MSFPFAILVLEREPPTWADLPAMLQSWVQDAGGFAALGLSVWFLAWLIQLGDRSNPFKEKLRGGRLYFVVAAVGYSIAYILLGIISLPSIVGAIEANDEVRYWQDILKTVGGAIALTAVLVPFLRDLPRWRWRRIWAIALLSAREVFRKKVYLVFCGLLLLFLFADWFIPHKPEDQLRNYVEVTYLSMAVLLVLTMAVLASFSIPTDISNQTIHTIVTKPVERFEIVLGRFVGFVGLMTLTLAALSACSLLFVQFHGVHPDSRAESYTARVPVYGKLQFAGTKNEGKGESVGREWEYRSFIAGGPNTPQRAIWDFTELPTRLDERGDVPCEFAFDIFRTRRPDREGQGVSCSFIFMTREWQQSRQDEYNRARKKLEERQPPLTPEQVAEELATQFGYFEHASKEITDYHTQSFRVPVGLFKNAAKHRKEDGDVLMRVIVKCETPSQFIGVAKRDLYLLDAQGYYGINFFKGAIGLWFWLVLIIGLAVACGTYLSGVISLVCALFLFVLGIFRNFIISVALGQSEGGGPAVGAYRLFTHANLTQDLDRTPTVRIAAVSDDVYRFFMRKFLNVIPDVGFYDMTKYVAEGFDIPLSLLGLNALVLFGYLLPWGILAYYLMKSREVAS